jgi:hypothetical protein
MSSDYNVKFAGDVDFWVPFLEPAAGREPAECGPFRPR